MTRVTAVFDDRAQAERAVVELRRSNVPDSRLSVVARRQDDVEVTGGAGADSTAARVGKGAAAGAGVGALFGLATALIPGVGPFITAGFLAQALGATGAAAATGAIIGGTSGAVAGALVKAGYSREEADFYGPTVERGGVLVAVDAPTGEEDRVRSILTQSGGSSYGAAPGAEREITPGEQYRAP